MLQKDPNQPRPSWARFRRPGALILYFLALAAFPMAATFGVYAGSTAPGWARLLMALINSYFFVSLVFDHIQRARLRPHEDDPSDS